MRRNTLHRSTVGGGLLSLRQRKTRALSCQCGDLSPVLLSGGRWLWLHQKPQRIVTAFVTWQLLLLSRCLYTSD